MKNTFLHHNKIKVLIFLTANFFLPFISAPLPLFILYISTHFSSFTDPILSLSCHFTFLLSFSLSLLFLFIFLSSFLYLLSFSHSFFFQRKGWYFPDYALATPTSPLKENTPICSIWQVPLRVKHIPLNCNSFKQTCSKYYHTTNLKDLF